MRMLVSWFPNHVHLISSSSVYRSPDHHPIAPSVVSPTLPLPQPSSLAVTTVASDSSTTGDSDTHTHTHTHTPTHCGNQILYRRILTCHNNRLCAVCYQFGSDPNILLAVSERDSFGCADFVFSGEWVCQAQPLSPVLDRLHEMAEGVTTR